VLYALLLFRRGHELEPLHDDLVARVARAEEARAGREPAPVEIAADLDQLITWGAVERQTEAVKLRGYKDNRLRRFRYRLSDDALALLEWLEARLAARVQGRARDGRDRLADVAGALRELRRVLSAWRDGQHGGEEARRAMYLAERVVEIAAAMSDEVLELRAEMIFFAGRPFDAAALRELLAWLEQFVAIYLVRLEELRGEVEDRLREVSAPRFVQALEECRAALLGERALVPPSLRGGAVREAGDLLSDAAGFFRAGGRLADLVRLVEESARQVALKIHRHLRELERRSARRADLRAAVRLVAALPEAAAGEPLCAWAGSIVAAAHLRTAAIPVEGRARPPSPRRYAQSGGAERASRPLQRKRLGREEARALEARRLAELGDWIERAVLGGQAQVRLSEVAGGLGESAPRRLVDLARARHLSGGRKLARVGVTITAASGRAVVTAGDEGLDAPDCEVARVGEIA
jgi:hypothetical protein